MLLREENKHGIPLIFTFIEGTLINDIKLDKNNKLLVHLFYNKSNMEVFFHTKSGSSTYFYLRALPFLKIIDIELHPDYKNLKALESFKNRGNEIINQLFESIKLNEIKTIVFEFSDYVYLPAYDLVPIKFLKLNIGVLSLSWDGSRNYKLNVVCYSKNSKKKFYKVNYFPFNQCIGFEDYENHMFKKGNDLLKTKIKEISEIKIRTTKTKEIKELIIVPENFIDKEKILGLYPLIYSLKLNKTIDRTHENCLICGTKLFSKEQIYVHLLVDGNLTTNPKKDANNHFNFFPVGKECLSLIPEDYQFLKTDILNSNR